MLAILNAQDRDDQMNIVRMFDNFIYRDHVCITFEPLGMNLYELIKQNNFQGFGLQYVRELAHSKLQCLVGLFRNSIIHADIKPENILVKGEGRSGVKVIVKEEGRSGVKVIDFGSSCHADELVHNYLQPRFFRAPEVFFGGWIGLPIDMWSFGYTLA